MRHPAIVTTMMLFLLLFSLPAAQAKSSGQEALLMTGTAYYLYLHDQDIKNWSQAHRSVGTDRLSSFSRNFGDVRVTAPALGIAYLYGKNQQNGKLAHTALYGLESLLISDAVAASLKLTVHRHRPNTGASPDVFDGPGLKTENVSFPSGHAASAFAVATVVATQYSDKKNLPQLSYGLAGLTALSRINDNEHWASDVFVGAAIGYYTAKAVVRLREHPSSNQDDIQPAVPLICLQKAL